MFAKALEIAASVAAEQRVAGLGEITLRKFCDSPDFGLPYLTQQAGDSGPVMTPIAWAIVDAIDGTPITTIDDETSLRIFGCVRSSVTEKRARMYAISAGGRAGKTSRFLAIVGLWLAWTVPLPHLAPEEKPFVMLTAPTRELAQRLVSFCKGVVRSSPRMRACEAESKAQSFVLKRPDGVNVLVQVSAKGRLAGRAGTMIAFLVDEACFFPEDGPFNIRDLINGAAQRVPKSTRKKGLDGVERIYGGGIVAMVSSPWIDGDGYMQEVLAKNTGKHVDCLAVQFVATKDLNPNWDPDGSLEKDYRANHGDELGDREFLAIPLKKGTRRFFSPKKLALCEKIVPESTDRIVQIGAGSDLGMRRDASAIVIVARWVSGLFTIQGLKYERADDEGALVPEVVCTAFALFARSRGASAVVSDIHYQDTFKTHLNAAGMGHIEAPTGRAGKNGAFMALHQVIAAERLGMGMLDDDPREDLIDQLERVIERRTPNGATIELPRRAVKSEADAAAGLKDHCDGAAALALALWAAGAGAGELRDPHERALSLPGSAASRSGGDRATSSASLSIGRGPRMMGTRRLA